MVPTATARDGTVATPSRTPRPTGGPGRPGRTAGPARRNGRRGRTGTGWSGGGSADRPYRPRTGRRHRATERAVGRDGAGPDGRRDDRRRDGSGGRDRPWTRTRAPAGRRRARAGTSGTGRSERGSGADRPRRSAGGGPRGGDREPGGESGYRDRRSGTGSGAGSGRPAGYRDGPDRGYSGGDDRGRSRPGGSADRGYPSRDRQLDVGPLRSRRPRRRRAGPQGPDRGGPSRPIGGLSPRRARGHRPDDRGPTGSARDDQRPTGAAATGPTAVAHRCQRRGRGDRGRADRVRSRPAGRTTTEGTVEAVPEPALSEEITASQLDAEVRAGPARPAEGHRRTVWRGISSRPARWSTTTPSRRWSTPATRASGRPASPSCARRPASPRTTPASGPRPSASCGRPAGWAADPVTCR